MLRFKHGVTRSVLLTKRYAIKFPTLRYGWAMFLRGLLSNMQEKKFDCMCNDMKLCPVLLAIPGGFMSVMPRCDPLTDFMWAIVEMGQEDHGAGSWNGFSADWKRENFGMLNGEVVLLDYGEWT